MEREDMKYIVAVGIIAFVIGFMMSGIMPYETTRQLATAAHAEK
jgi:hypothetical protein